ncbi:hypothetical protein C8R43DRAFT_83083 [Mycena crocata]|nr:hypothetical protein C8R43DRAFT_83083 [Mycena crocata]
MEAVHAEGLTRSIGVSNFSIEDLKAFLPGAKVVPVCNQLEIHPWVAYTSLTDVPKTFHRYVWKAGEPIVRYGREHGRITAVSYGGLTPIVRVAAANGPVDEVLPPIVERLSQVLGKPVTAAQVLSKWISHKGAIVVTWVMKE